MRRIFGVTGSAVLAILLLAPAGLADEAKVAGFEVVSTTTRGPGLVHTVLRRGGPPQVVHVARLSQGSRLRLRAVLSNEAVSGPGARLERTSSMCARVSCVVAVNGDFAGIGTDEPVGSMVVDGEMVRTPVASHHQFVTGDNVFSAGGLATHTQIVPTDLKGLTADAVNRPRGDGQIVLYTPANGPTTGTNPHGAELVLEGDRIVTNQTVVARMLTLVEGGNASISRGRVVLSGHGAGADALRSLWQRAQSGAVARELMIRVDTSAPADTVIGGTPVLVRDGRRFVASTGDAFVTGRHPRTVVGWTKERDVLLVTADGRQPENSVGMTLPEMADLMVALGAVDALNLDGGGSTTFVAGAQIVNSPSDRIVMRGGTAMVVHEPRSGDQVAGPAERPVVSALAIVDDESATRRVASAPPGAPARTVRYFAVADPASFPDGDVAALLGESEGPQVGRPLLLIALVLFGCVTFVVVRQRRRSDAA
ncbi:MAG TPA: phosphodiester glycosidase family protein [Acidimicrobiales bacterium]|nr:phosphodiester glycosidase family protein [Acidimicrobiales bacterium]